VPIVSPSCESQKRPVLVQCPPSAEDRLLAGPARSQSRSRGRTAPRPKFAPRRCLPPPTPSREVRSPLDENTIGDLPTGRGMTAQAETAAGGEAEASIAVELIAVLVAVAEGRPLAMTIDDGRALPSGPFEVGRRSLQSGLRAWAGISIRPH
jgi:hypothetical protein